MSKDKHTPGPWVTDGYDVIRENKPPLGEIIAHVQSWKKGDETARLNAALIAEAPELLKALEHAVNIIKENLPQEENRQYFYDLINKAKGKYNV